MSDTSSSTSASDTEEDENSEREMEERKRRLPLGTSKGFYTKERRRKRAATNVAGAEMEKMSEVLEQCRLKKPQTRNMSTSKAKIFCEIYDAGKHVLPEAPIAGIESTILARIALPLAGLKIAQDSRKRNVLKLTVPHQRFLNAIVEAFKAADKEGAYLSKLKSLETESVNDFKNGLRSLFNGGGKKPRYRANTERFRDAVDSVMANIPGVFIQSPEGKLSHACADSLDNESITIRSLQAQVDDIAYAQKRVEKKLDLILVTIQDAYSHYDRTQTLFPDA
mmetsp:Transcript_18404/g.24024  ORF Transcript_18404/g.24024 Transcript_18404/m.24024 type:complete len:280 (+) Transcript_18404:142-981(+)|eukprot:CAMPEP_0184006912 /NCGR_PEP_ID=MMETSP0954-20121128/998_1 /TAXON_ID=627963 /ORGANISM="Aplanochytrium sp, Strain PBS07" /LENGTH=279 /DNA_ID=CAMNT_0026285597 /DNA_START=109 /DNA_END=948 /DNA_ORIENTATION=+